MNHVKSSDIEKMPLDDSFYSELSSVMTSQKNKKDNWLKKRSVKLSLVLSFFISFAVVIYIISHISKLKAERAELTAMIEGFKVRMDDMSAQHTLLSDQLSRAQEDYMAIRQKLNQQTESNKQLEKTNEQQCALLMNKEFDLKKQIEALSNENLQKKKENSELKDIISNLSSKIEDYAKKGDETIFKKIKKALRTIKEKVFG